MIAPEPPRSAASQNLSPASDSGNSGRSQKMLAELCRSWGKAASNANYSAECGHRPGGDLRHDGAPDDGAHRHILDEEEHQRPHGRHEGVVGRPFLQAVTPGDEEIAHRHRIIEG